MKKAFIAMMVAGTIIAGGCGPKEEQGTPAIDLKNMDLSINPADDFFIFLFIINFYLFLLSFSYRSPSNFNSICNLRISG